MVWSASDITTTPRSENFIYDFVEHVSSTCCQLAEKKMHEAKKSVVQRSKCNRRKPNTLCPSNLFASVKNAKFKWVFGFFPLLKLTNAMLLQPAEEWSYNLILLNFFPLVIYVLLFAPLTHTSLSCEINSVWFIPNIPVCNLHESSILLDSWKWAHISDMVHE